MSTECETGPLIRHSHFAVATLRRWWDGEGGTATRTPPACLDLVPDPRGVRGRRYRLSALVAAAAARVLAGARSLTAITEWISDAPAWACQVLGFPTDPLSGTVSVPHPHTLRRPLVQLDGDAPARAIGAARATPAGPGRKCDAQANASRRASCCNTLRSAAFVMAPRVLDPELRIRRRPL
ncbi:transposase family protein [Streptomyces sp. MUM 136J]|uniref:transposase family protein n=1 Tax=Streptomyces sp. MUM 136J TaxID=2791992 RepID=UPI001F049EE3|nr:transposase family protein [Streptomyces sp. MUM 136J]